VVALVLSIPLVLDINYGRNGAHRGRSSIKSKKRNL
jgi:hypothetical protein